MCNRILKSALLLAVCLPTLAMAQEQRAAFRGAQSFEFSLGAGVSVLDASLRDFLAAGAPESRFANSRPGAIAPTVTGRVGYNFGQHWGLSVATTAAFGSGVRYLTPSGAFTWTCNLSARTSPFLLVGTELTRIDGVNHRTTHSTWGAMGGVGIRHMIADRLALRLEGRVRYEAYQDFGQAHAWTPVVTLGFTFFGRGRRPDF